MAVSAVMISELYVYTYMYVGLGQMFEYSDTFFIWLERRLKFNLGRFEPLVLHKLIIKNSQNYIHSLKWSETKDKWPAIVKKPANSGHMYLPTNT